MLQEIKNLLSYKSYISRSWFLLILIAVFLTIISFVKGIQILIFIPSFIISIFLYSLLELFFIKKSLNVSVYNDNKWNFLKIFVNKKFHSHFFLGNKNEAWEMEFLEIQHWNIYTLEKHKNYNLELFLFGSFDIFRKKINIWKLIISWNNYKKNSYIISEKYDESKEISKLDSLKTSLSDTPFVKEMNYINRDKIDPNQLCVVSNGNFFISQNLEIKKIHFLLVLLWIIWLFIEWNDLVLNSILLINIFLVFLFRNKKWEIKNIYKNIILLTTFFIMLILTYIQRDMSGPWSLFLLQILINIYLFPKDFKNSFLYIFLLLFVFVAISLFSNQIRFIILFLLYIFFSIYLLFWISWSEEFDTNNYTFWKEYWFWSKVKISCIIIILMFIFYFILPHGNKVEDQSEIFFNNSEWSVSWFNDNITLDNIWDISQDNSKVIIIEDISPEEIENLWIKYFRWKRFNYFNGEKWVYTLWNQYKRFENSVLEIDENISHKNLKIKFELNWWKNIFFPAKPIKVETKIDRLISKNSDLTTLELTRWINETFSLDVNFLQKDWKIVDYQPNNLSITNEISPQIDELFEDYFAQIPDEYKNSAEKLTQYVKEESWFDYSVTDISNNFEDFLYGTQNGHCEYFASTLMIVLQKYWFKPTLVSWFLQWEHNSLVNSYIVRAKNAHSWVEIYDEESQQWKIYDATPEIDFSLTTTLWKFYSQAVNIYDYIDIRWYTYIANFTWEEQIIILKKIINNKWNILKNIFILIFFYFIVIWFIKSKKIILLSKNEKILLFLSKYYKTDNNVLIEVNKVDKIFAKKLEKYVYANKWNVSYFEIIKKIILKKED